MKFIEVTAGKGTEFGIGLDGEKAPKKSGIIVDGNSGPVSMGVLIFTEIQEVHGDPKVKSVIFIEIQQGHPGA
jgi:hypothetical protein